MCGFVKINDLELVKTADNRNNIDKINFAIIKAESIISIEEDNRNIIIHCPGIKYKKYFTNDKDKQIYLERLFKSILVATGKKTIGARAFINGDDVI